MTFANYPKRIALTASTGHIGTQLCSLIADADEMDYSISIMAGTRSPEEHPHKCITPCYFDFNDLNSQKALLQGVEILVLCCPYSVSMLKWGKTMVDTARKSDVKHIVYVGAHAYSDTDVSVHCWHQLLQEYVKSSGLKWTILKPNWFMENMLRGKPDRVGKYGILISALKSDVPIGWISSKDIAKAILTIIKEPNRHWGQTYTLSSEVANYDILRDKLSEILNRKIFYFQWPVESLYRALIKHNYEEVYAKEVVRLQERTNRNESDEYSIVSNDFQKLCKEPALTLDEFLKENFTPLSPKLNLGKCARLCLRILIRVEKQKARFFT